METKILAWDIETKPRLDLVKQFNTYDVADVKYGNAKDPVKRAKIEADHEIAFWQKKNDKAALDPATAEVCAIGYQGAATIIDIRPSEKEMIEAFWQTYKDIDSGAREICSMVGWNIFGFDLPFLIKRSWILGISIPRGVTNGRYYDKMFIDAKAEWNQWEYGWQMKAGLSQVAKLLNVHQPRLHNVKGANFSKVLETHYDKAHAYLSDDVQELYDIANRILNNK